MSPSPQEIRLRNQLQSLLSASIPEAPSWKELWQLARNLYQLRLYLHHNHAETIELFEQAETIIQQVSARFFAQTSNAHIQDSLRTTTHTLQRKLEQTIGDVSRPHWETLQQLQELQASLDALQWLSERCPPLAQSEHLTAEALADLSLLEREIQQVHTALQQARRNQPQVQPQTTPPAESTEALRTQVELLRQECSLLYGTLLRREMKQFLRDTKSASISHTEAPGLKHVNRTWLWLQHGEELQFAFQREKLKRGTYVPGKLAELHKQTEQRCAELRQHMAQLSEQLSGPQMREWWGKHLRYLLDDIDDQMATLDDQALELAIRQLEQMEQQTTWLASVVLSLQNAQPSPNPDVEREFQQATQQLKRIQYRLQVEQQERKLQNKLEDKFGPTMVARVENTVIILILLILLFLIAEFSFNLSPTTQFILMWADTLICLFFLVEFGTKLAYAEGRWLYFRRHFLIDLLPALPFGFFLWVLQTQSALQYLTAGRAARFVRLSRLARYIRIIRPLIRIFRLFSFLVRAIGSVLRKYEPLFNRNIIIFPSPEESYVPQQQRQRLEVQQLRERCRRRLKMHIHQLETTDKLAFVKGQLSHLRDHLERFADQSQVFGPSIQAAEVVYLPKLINRMIHIDAIEVEEVLGRNFVQQIHRIFRYLSLPFVGHIPGFRRISKVYKEQDPAGMLAWLIRSWGRTLQRIQAAIHWFGDTYGIITGPQVLDRIGNTMINATLRPARRLLLFGFFFLLVSGLIYAFSIDSLKGTATFLAKFLGTPIIVLGSISMIPLLVGFWFRRIASASSDFFGRVAEAQFIGHLKQIKRHQTPKDLAHLIQRVLHPEALLRQRELPPEGELIQELTRQLQGIGELDEYHNTSSMPSITSAKEPESDIAVQTSRSMTRSARYLDRDRVLLVYEDYLGGSPLHRSDTPTTNQLLGNITIQNIRRHRLTLSLFDNMRIDRLDLSRPRLLHFLGPYLWFTAITESLSHRVARLIVEYNQNCMTLTEMRWQSEAAKENYEAWLKQRQERVKGKLLPPSKETPEQQEFRTTAFTALHFLSTNEERDEAIRETFGKRVLQLVQAERRLLFREIFGFYPFHELPKEYRTINIYQLYLEHLAGGRFFLLPFKLLWWWLKGIFWLFGRTRQLVRDVLKPPSQDDIARAGHAPFEVAIRKINRMRKPIYVEYMRLRAMLDVEYLGLFLPGLSDSGVEGHTYRADLTFISASAQEHQEFLDLSQQRAEQLRLFDAFLRHHQWKGEQLQSYLADIDPALARQWRAVLRAMTSAFAADYHQVRSLIQAEQALQQLLEEGCQAEKPPPKRRRWWAHTLRTINRLVFLQKDREYEAICKLWQRSPHADAGEQAQRRCWLLYLSRRKQMMPVLMLATEEDQTPWERARIVLDEVIRNNSIWTEELLTMRTLQTITRLDLRLYRELVYTLGDYHEADAMEDDERP